MKKAFKILGFVVLGIVLVAAAGALYVRLALPNVDPAPALSFTKTSVQVERGRYLANHVAVCIDCHSERDWSRFSGPIKPGTEGKGGDVFDHNFGFPGTFYARNITSDPETGIGNWTDGEIYRAITTGVNRKGDPLFPIMPYQSYSHMQEEDVRSIIAYIRTLDPIKHKVPESKPDFPMNFILRTIPANRKPVKEEVFTDAVSKGKYLLTIGGCADCHTPHVKGAPVAGKHLAGGFEFKLPAGVLRSANLTPDKETGIGNWTENDFVQRFKAYAAPEATEKQLSEDEFNSIMPWKMYSGMEENDLRAIYSYLMSLEPNPNKMERFTPANQKLVKN